MMGALQFRSDAVSTLTLLAMVFYGGAFACWLARKPAGLWIFYGAGFACGLTALVTRGWLVAHVPFQTLLEVFLVLGTAVFPLSVFCRAVLRIRGEGIDALLGVLLLFPSALVFDAGPRLLPPALQSPLFIPHVATYLAAYVVLAKAVVWAVAVLIGRPRKLPPGLLPPAEAMDRLVRMGLPLLTAGLLLGAVWAEQAFGAFWQWDPKELLALASWLAFAGYFHVGLLPGRPRRRLAAGVVLWGGVLIVATLLWVNVISVASYHSYAN